MEDAKKSLTKFLTKGSGDDIDRTTEFPDTNAVRLQRFYRILGEEFDLDFFENEADRIANIMWSWKRKSREEAVDSMGRTEESDIMNVGPVKDAGED